MINNIKYTLLQIHIFVTVFFYILTIILRFYFLLRLKKEKLFSTIYIFFPKDYWMLNVVT